MKTHQADSQAVVSADPAPSQTPTETYYRTLFDYAPDGILIADGDSRYLDANPSMCRMLGFSRDEIVGKHAADIVAPLEAGHIGAALKELSTNTDHHRQWQFKRKDGSHFPAEVTATKMSDGNLLAMVRDISERRQSEALSTRLASIVESSDDAIISSDLANIVTSWNGGAERIFGYSAAEILGSSAGCLVPAQCCDEEEAVQRQIGAGHGIEQFETVRRTKDGRLIDVSITTAPLKDAAGIVVGSSKIMRDVTLAKAREREISTLSRLYSALSQVNHALVRVSTRAELLQQICRALVWEGGFKMAWIGWFQPDTRQIIPIADCGDEDGHIHRIRIYGDERPEGCGPTGLAFRSEKPFICNDLRNDPIVLPWREGMIQRGFRSSAAFPIQENGRVCGTLTVLSDEPHFFNSKEITLLEEAVANVSFGLDNLKREQERVRAEALAANEKRFSDTMLESMPGVLYFYDAQGRFLRWNRNFEVVSGYTGTEISTMHPLDFFLPEEKPMVGARVAEVFATGGSAVEALFVSKSGEHRPYFFTGKKVVFNDMECLVGMGIDITELRQAELKLSESERKYRELVEHANSIILRWNSEGRITFLNEFGQRYFGYTADEIVGRHVIGTIVPAEDSEGRDLQSLMQQICDNPTAFEQNINQNVRRNGERVWIAWTNKLVFDAEGRIVEIFSVGSDITDRRRAEETIRELNTTLERRVVERTEALNAALVRAEAADKIKSAFLATMSHELRTPLNSIIGFTGILCQGLAGPLNAEQLKQLGMVRSSARHLLELINDVLDLSKIEAGQLQIKVEPFDLRESVDRAMSLVKPFADKKELALSQSIADGIGEIVNDRRRFEQILINLLSNSIKFTDRGSVSLSVTAEAGHCFPDASVKPAILIRIADTGIGIKPGDLEALFQAFHQLDTGLSRQHEGSGLGLAICRRLTLLMGGDISVRSTWSKGSEFTVALPLQVEGDAS